MAYYQQWQQFHSNLNEHKTWDTIDISPITIIFNSERQFFKLDFILLLDGVKLLPKLPTGMLSGVWLVC